MQDDAEGEVAEVTSFVSQIMDLLADLLPSMPGVSFVSVELGEADKPRINVHESVGFTTFTRKIESGFTATVEKLLEQVRAFARRFQDHLGTITFLGIDPKFNMLTVHADRKAYGY